VRRNRTVGEADSGAWTRARQAQHAV